LERSPRGQPPSKAARDRATGAHQCPESSAESRGGCREPGGGAASHMARRPEPQIGARAAQPAEALTRRSARPKPWFGCFQGGLVPPRRGRGPPRGNPQNAPPPAGPRLSAQAKANALVRPVGRSAFSAGSRLRDASTAPDWRPPRGCKRAAWARANKSGVCRGPVGEGGARAGPLLFLFLFSCARVWCTRAGLHARRKANCAGVCKRAPRGRAPVPCFGQVARAQPRGRGPRAWFWGGVGGRECISLSGRKASQSKARDNARCSNRGRARAAQKIPATGARAEPEGAHMGRGTVLSNCPKRNNKRAHTATREKRAIPPACLARQAGGAGGPVFPPPICWLCLHSCVTYGVGLQP
jgi:hypothetical protein